MQNDTPVKNSPLKQEPNVGQRTDLGGAAGGGGKPELSAKMFPISVAPRRQPRLCADGIGRGHDSESVLLILSQPSRSASIGEAVGERSLIGPVASERRRKTNATLSLGCRSSTVVTTSNARWPATYC